MRVRMGLLGRADVPVALVDRIGVMRWPWWGGVGVRLGKGLVAFVAAPGEAAVLELGEPLTVRAPAALDDAPAGGRAPTTSRASSRPWPRPGGPAGRTRRSPSEPGRQSGWMTTISLPSGS